MNLQRDLKRYLKRHKMSQAEFAAHAGVPRTSINKIIKGERKGLHMENLQKVMNLLYDYRPRE